MCTHRTNKAIIWINFYLTIQYDVKAIYRFTFAGNIVTRFCKAETKNNISWSQTKFIVHKILNSRAEAPRLGLDWTGAKGPVVNPVINIIRSLWTTEYRLLVSTWLKNHYPVSRRATFAFACFLKLEFGGSLLDPTWNIRKYCELCRILGTQLETGEHIKFRKHTQSNPKGSKIRRQFTLMKNKTTQLSINPAGQQPAAVAVAATQGTYRSAWAEQPRRSCGWRSPGGTAGGAPAPGTRSLHTNGNQAPD